jgi:hypothetical protein
LFNRRIALFQHIRQQQTFVFVDRIVRVGLVFYQFFDDVAHGTGIGAARR